MPLARLLYPAAEVHGLRLHGRPDAAVLHENRAVFRQWRTMDFQAVYNCNFAGLTAAICRLFEAERVMGYRPARTAAGGIDALSWARLAFRLSERRAFSPLNLVDFWAHFAPVPLAAELVNPPAKPGGQGLGVVLAGRESRRSLPLPLLAKCCKPFSACWTARVFACWHGGGAARRAQALRLLPAKFKKRLKI